MSATEGPAARAGRPRTFDENAVVAQAMDVFWRLGSNRTTTRVLESELKLTQSSIYNAFGSKQELLDRALDLYDTELETKLLHPLEASGAERRDLVTFIEGFHDWVSTSGREGCMLLNLLTEGADVNMHAIERAGLFRERLRGAFTRILGDASRAEVLLAGILGVNIAARTGAAKAELRTMSAALVTLARA